MQKIKLEHTRKDRKAYKLAKKAWLADQRKSRVVGDEIKLNCTGNKKLIRVTGPAASELIQATEEAIERVRQNYPDLEIREATEEELNNWVTEQLNKTHYQGDAVVDEIIKFCSERLIGGPA